MQPTPEVTDADVERIVRRDFPADRIAEVLSILETYGTEAWHREPARVRLAALKLANGSMDGLRRAIETACCDYRDFLVSAEYPEYFMRMPGTGALPANTVRKIIDADWKQYQDWLTAEQSDEDSDRWA